jgi:hypothetical protein
MVKPISLSPYNLHFKLCSLLHILFNSILCFLYLTYSFFILIHIFYKLLVWASTTGQAGIRCKRESVRCEPLDEDPTVEGSFALKSPRSVRAFTKTTLLLPTVAPHVCHPTAALKCPSLDAIIAPDMPLHVGVAAPSTGHDMDMHGPQNQLRATARCWAQT